MTRLDAILARPDLNGVYRLARDPESLPASLVPVLDGRSLNDKAELLAALGRALDLPDYYGGNWDALEECLNDLSWREGPLWLVLYHADAVAADLLDTLVEIFAEAAAFWAEQGRACSLFLDSPARTGLPQAV
jgi:RNAse (barnase) inhibitor barstar